MFQKEKRQTPSGNEIFKNPSGHGFNILEKKEKRKIRLNCPAVKGWELGTKGGAER